MSHAPFVAHAESVTTMLDTLMEGHLYKIKVRVSHYEGDSTVVLLKDNPSFIDLAFRRRKESKVQDYYYEDSINWDTRIHIVDDQYSCGQFPELQMVVDSTHVGNTYEYSVIVRNRFGLGDTLHISSVVVPYDK
jgi:hypothetical protein